MVYNQHPDVVNATFKRLLRNSNSTLLDIFCIVEERLEEADMKYMKIGGTIFNFAFRRYCNYYIWRC